MSTGEVLYEAGDLIDEELLSSVKSLNIRNIKILMVDSNNAGPWLLNTIQNDKNFTREEALVDIYRVMRPGEPPAYESADELFKNLFSGADQIMELAKGRKKRGAKTWQRRNKS